MNRYSPFMIPRRHHLAGQGYVGDIMKKVALMNLDNDEWSIAHSGNPLLDGNFGLTDEFGPSLHAGKLVLVPRY